MLVDHPPPGWSPPPHHSGAYVGAGTDRRIPISSPAGLDEFFLEAGAPSAEGVDLGAARGTAERHGW